MQADFQTASPPRAQSYPRSRRLPVGPLLPEWLRPTNRPQLGYELALIGLSYWIYSLIRNAVPEHRTAAMHHAESLFAIERALHLDFEPAVNRAVDSVSWLIVGMNYYYATLHFIVTIGVLVWLYCFHPARYRSARTALYLTNAVALVGYYAVPLAPPRFFPEYGFIDTVVKHHTWGSWASGDVAAASNQYAAMPSMHVGWSLWCGITLFMLTRARWIRVLAVLYPIATITVIVSTGNHFVLDAVGGALALGLGFGAHYVLNGRPVYREPDESATRWSSPHPARTPA
jgi:PAP2 superfamily